MAVRWVGKFLGSKSAFQCDKTVLVFFLSSIMEDVYQLVSFEKNTALKAKEGLNNLKHPLKVTNTHAHGQL